MLCGWVPGLVDGCRRAASVVWMGAGPCGWVPRVFRRKTILQRRAAVWDLPSLAVRWLEQVEL